MVQECQMYLSDFSVYFFLTPRTRLHINTRKDWISQGAPSVVAHIIKSLKDQKVDVYVISGYVQGSHIMKVRYRGNSTAG